MSYSTSPAPVQLGAGTCVKIGFFVALGAFLFGLIVSVVALIVSLILGLVFGASLLSQFS